MKKLLSLTLLLAANFAFAEYVQRSTIETVAENMLSDGVISQILPNRTVRSIESYKKLWIINLSPNGYIVAAGSTLVEPLIFFSEGYFSEPPTNTPLYALLQRVNSRCELAEIANNATALSVLSITSTSENPHAEKWSKYSRKSSGLSAQAIVSNWGTVITEPLITTAWSQDQPYNDLSPVYQETPSGSYRNRTPCGCVATATAQVMNYWQWPKRIDADSTVNHGYDADGDGLAETNINIRFPAGELFYPLENEYTNWTYNSGVVYDLRGTVAESLRYPIAKLIFLAQNLVEMQFGASGSGAYNASAKKLPNYVAGEYLYEPEEFTEVPNAMKTSITNLCPVIVGINSVEGGHSIVGDGWAENTDTQFVHLNFGWGGHQTGWYNVDERDTSKIENAAIDEIVHSLKPTALPHLKPMAKIVPQNCEIAWDFANCHTNQVTGFTVTTTTPLSATTTWSDNFATQKGTIDGSASSVSITENNLVFSAPAFDVSYEYTELNVLTSSSVLTYEFCSYYGKLKQFYLEASFNGEEYSIIDTPTMKDYNTSFEIRTVNLADYAGKWMKLRFREIYPPNDSGSYYPTTKTKVRALSISNVKAIETSMQTLPATARSTTLNFTSGVTSATVTVASQGFSTQKKATAIFTISDNASTLATEITSVNNSSNTATDTPLVEAAISGTTVLRVETSKNVTNLTAKPSHLYLLPDSAVQVVKEKAGLFSIIITSSIPVERDRQRMLLTLIAENDEGLEDIHDVVLRFSQETASVPYSKNTNPGMILRLK